MKILVAISSCRRDTHNGFNQAMRDTWLKDLKRYPNVEYKFFVGDGTLTVGDDEDAIIRSQAGTGDKNRGIDYGAKGNSSAHAALREPQITPKEDEVVLQVPDDYRHIAVKVRGIFRWAAERGYDYVFKCEPDTYVVVDRWMKSGFEKHDIMGGPAGGNVAGGSGWWMSRRAILAVVDEPINTWSDDCWFPGLLGRKLGVRVHHDVRYSDNASSPQNDIITTHLGFKPTYAAPKMYAIHESMKKETKRALITISGWVMGAKNGDHQAIRDTWAGEVKKFPHFDYKFFIGDGTPLSTEDQDRLENGVLLSAANAGQKDKAFATKVQAPFDYTPKDDEIILQVPDGYMYLSYKTRESHRWAIERGYDYVFQCFPDTFIDIPKLVKSGFEKHDFTGFRIGHGYAAGGAGYWTSKKAVQAMLGFPIADWAEDRWAGDAIRAAGMKLMTDKRYGPHRNTAPNINNDIISCHLCDTPNIYDNRLMHQVYSESKNMGPSHRPPKKKGDGLTIDWWDTAAGRRMARDRALVK